MDDARIPIVVTLHGIRRYRERVAKVPARVVVETLSGPAFDACNRLGGGAVILPTGHRAVCGDGAVITVLPRGCKFMGFIGKRRR
ncbi:hypothetical protein [Sphingopyxis macrogoltabida]|uniref:Uncharacterized protein n=1 Tax=Sphingopyxis macrogoltabida TaxID=33050 RepID=A0A0N9V0W8_SPHMC|nr:hypothetical protein [Sphingopyxis macrogoltabida]ALH82920.1 hypothetical protein AN936_21945 [Sphingopyxis macrogoltabida]